jgi:hypothetical protein
MAEERGADFRTAERQAEMAGIAGVNGIHREAARFVGSARKRFEIHRLVRCEF